MSTHIKKVSSNLAFVKHAHNLTFHASNVSKNYGDAMGVCRYNVEGNGNEAVSRDK